MVHRSVLAALATAALGGAPAAAAGEPTAPFTEEAAATGLDFVHFNGMSGELYLLEIMGAGAGFVDYDRDGDLDAYLVQGAMLGPGKTPADALMPFPGPHPPSDRLFRNDLHAGPDGRAVLRFTDVTERSGVAEAGYGMGVAAGDVDGDGWQDLYVANYGPNRLLRNRGDGTFADATGPSGTDDRRWSVAGSFFDYDRDGRLDLYVVDYLAFDFTVHRVCKSAAGADEYCGPLAFAPVPGSLFHNLGDGRFEEVSGRARAGSEPATGMGVVATDADGDGWTDLYVTNDAMANFLWLNQGDGAFTEEALLAGVAVNRDGRAEASMGIDAADVDDDGDEDLFLTHLTGETNTFYRNLGGGVFLDDTLATGLGPPSLDFTGFGTAFFDYDNDGRLDLFVANGAVRKLEALVLAGDPFPLHQPNQLFRNVSAGGDGVRFEDVTARGGEPFRLSEVSRGAAFGDVDGDGDTDLLVSNNGGPARLLVNRVGQASRWLGVEVLDAAGAPAIGARVALVRSGRPTLRRRVKTDGSYASALDPRVIFGLGGDPAVERLRVVWPDGRVQEWVDPPADRRLTIQREEP